MKNLRKIARDVDPETGDVRYFKPGTCSRFDAIVAAGDPTCQHPLPASKAHKAHRKRRRKQHYADCPPRPLFHTRMADEPELNERRLIRQQVFADAGHRCQQCGARWPLTLDHIIPLSRGGGWHRENLQCLCQPCNQAKGDQMPYERQAA